VYSASIDAERRAPDPLDTVFADSAAVRRLGADGRHRVQVARNPDPAQDVRYERKAGDDRHGVPEPTGSAGAALECGATAINDGDRDGFFATLTEDATMSDDGRALVARYSNSTWGAMHTAWKFEIEGDRVRRFETGQAQRPPAQPSSCAGCDVASCGTARSRPVNSNKVTTAPTASAPAAHQKATA